MKPIWSSSKVSLANRNHSLGEWRLYQIDFSLSGLYRIYFSLYRINLSCVSKWLYMCIETTSICIETWLASKRLCIETTINRYDCDTYKLKKTISSQFDRRLFRSRVHSIETETQCIIYRLFFILLATAKLNIVKQIWFVSIETTLDRNNLRTDHDSHSNKQEYSIDPEHCNIATYDRVIALVKNIIFSTLDSQVLRPLYTYICSNINPEAFLHRVDRWNHARLSENVASWVIALIPRAPTWEINGFQRRLP